MTAWHDDGQARFYMGDCREVLRSLPAESVQMLVTSPPYWSLRDYGVEPTVWGGDADHLHDWESETVTRQNRTGLGMAALGEKYRGGGHKAGIIPEQQFERANCVCGAWRGALGLEPDPGMYVEHIVEVFREVKRVLRKDGTLWLNIGDSYAASRSGPVGDFSTLDGGNSAQKASREAAAASRFGGRSRTRERFPEMGIKPKDLMGIPWMVAFALQADGWYLRQDIIWAKPNPMPESVQDRCTKAHEYLFLLSKSPRYYSDFEAIREPATDPGRENGRDGRPEYADHRRLPPGAHPQTLARQDFTARGRNKRSVWTIPTSPFPEAHFAIFPQALVEPCILAGSREGDTVLDPFLGSGTTAMVAKRLGRRAIGIDMKAEYLEMAVRRVGEQLARLEGAE